MAGGKCYSYSVTFGKVVRKILDIGSLFVMGILAPTALAVLVSWNSLPGETAYPLKLGLENLAIFAAQVHEPTEMGIRMGVLDRRFQEARVVMENERSTRGYQYFTEAAVSTEQAVLGIGDTALRERYRAELAEDLRRYNAELTSLINSLESP